MSSVSGTVSRAAEPAASPHDRTNKAWTDGETCYLLQRAAEGMAAPEIAKRLDRTIRAITSHIDDILADRVHYPIATVGYVVAIRRAPERGPPAPPRPQGTPARR